MRNPSVDAARMVRELRERAGLTQLELAEKVGTTQSVISRLESDRYEGHSLSMLSRIAAALGARIELRATGGGGGSQVVRERGPAYAEDGPAGSPTDEGPRSSVAASGHLTDRQTERLAQRLAQRFADRGITEADVREAIRWACGAPAVGSIEELRGAIRVGPGDVVADVRRARARRGRPVERRSERRR